MYPILIFYYMATTKRHGFLVYLSIIIKNMMTSVNYLTGGKYNSKYIEF